MLTSSMRRAAIGATALSLLVATHPGAPARALDAVVPIETLSLDQRLKMPDSTRVTISKTRSTTLGMLRAFHASHLQSLKNARALGNKAALAIRNQNLRLVANRMVRLTNGSVRQLRATPLEKNVYALDDAARSGFLAGIVFTVTTTPAPAATAASQPSLLGDIIPEPTSTLQRYAKDYQDFCSAHAATACIYLPPGLSWGAGALDDHVSNPDPAFETILAPDYLITDPDICAAGGGHISYPGFIDAKVCVYTYPVYVKTQFLPAAKNNPYVAWCPYTPDKTDWLIQVDKHGAALVSAGAWGLGHTFEPYERTVGAGDVRPAGVHRLRVAITRNHAHYRARNVVQHFGVVPTAIVEYAQDIVVIADVITLASVQRAAGPA